ncbi:N-lysine methyltransferase KMT5A-like [Antechinus flavipes]|uniref:N-lysine methyltransferase KMT5A-like n=1 Tax=Antechinus flavipes TaxID=38775 RepID=UPI00223619C8|nr:N-lysine methyltransferase KMT5A-like [Antechinus flavipes]
MKSKVQARSSGRRRQIRTRSQSKALKAKRLARKLARYQMVAQYQILTRSRVRAARREAEASTSSETMVAAFTRSRSRAALRVQGRKETGSRKRILKAKHPSRNYRVTDYFPVRRSTRKNRGELRTEERIRLNALIQSGKEEGMRVGLFEGKGRGVITTKPFQRGDYVVEYHGDLIDLALAKKREARYAKDPDTGCYMYYFHYRSKGYCVDATKESGRLGRLINHSKSGNCQTKLHPINGVPHLIVIATRDIAVGEELLYDYGDRSKASLEAYPWLKY